MHEQNKRSASGIIRAMIEGNSSFMNDHQKEYFKPFEKAQTPEVTLVTCSDSRVQVGIFGGDATNRIFVIRDIGNQIIPVFGSVDYGVIHLKTPLLLILGHTHCGAMKSILADYDNEPFDIIRELDHLSIPVRHLKHAGEEGEEIWLEAVESNVDYQVRLAVKKYKRLIDAGMLTVIGAVDDFINAYGQGHGKVSLVNINGETETSVIKSHEMLDGIQKSVIDRAVIRAS